MSNWRQSQTRLRSTADCWDCNPRLDAIWKICSLGQIVEIAIQDWIQYDDSALYRTLLRLQSKLGCSMKTLLYIAHCWDCNPSLDAIWRLFSVSHIVEIAIPDWIQYEDSALYCILLRLQSKLRCNMKTLLCTAHCWDCNPRLNSIWRLCCLGQIVEIAIHDWIQYENSAL